MDFPSSVCLALYRRLANAYPHEFRMLYGEDMDRLGEDAIPEVWRQYGVPGVIRLLADIAFRLPATWPCFRWRSVSVCVPQSVASSKASWARQQAYQIPRRS